MANGTLSEESGDETHSRGSSDTFRGHLASDPAASAASQALPRTTRRPRGPRRDPTGQASRLRPREADAGPCVPNWVQASGQWRRGQGRQLAARPQLRGRPAVCQRSRCSGSRPPRRGPPAPPGQFRAHLHFGTAPMPAGTGPAAGEGDQGVTGRVPAPASAPSRCRPPALTCRPAPARGCRAKAPRPRRRRTRTLGGFASAAGAAFGPPARAPWRGGGGAVAGCPESLRDGHRARRLWPRAKCLSGTRRRHHRRHLPGFENGGRATASQSGRSGRLLGNARPAPLHAFRLIRRGPPIFSRTVFT